MTVTEEAAELLSRIGKKPVSECARLRYDQLPGSHPCAESRARPYRSDQPEWRAGHAAAAGSGQLAS